MLRIVIDTDVLIAGLTSPTGASAELLVRAIRGEVTLLLSVAILLEYEAVATRADQLTRAGATAEQVVNVIDALAKVSDRVPVRFSWRPQLRDPNDEMILEAAVNGRADSIVSFNRRDFGDAPGRFGIDVVRPAEILRRLENGDE